jgi:hypothetical protein
MPTDASILGFGNRWYARAVESSESVSNGERTIHIAPAALFTAMKIDAFSGRGYLDFTSSHDIEDIITLVDGRAELEKDVRHASAEVRQHVSSTFGHWLEDERFLAAVSGHLMPDQASQARHVIVLDRMRKIAALGA